MILSERHWLGIALGIGVLVGGVYLAIGFYYQPDAGVSVELRDAYLFYQYGAALAQGHPYSFMPGDPPSTGSTSHLYPVLLGVFYWMGARGDALSVAAAFASFTSYLSCIGLLWLIARRLAPRALPLVVLLSATSGHLAISIFDQTDATLSVPLALSAFAALIYSRVGLLSASLVLLSLARPDGFVVAFSLLLMTFFSVGGSVSRRGLQVAAALGIMAFFATLILHLILTGIPTPFSVLAKGPFHDYSFFGAVNLVTRAASRIFVELGLGIGDKMRQMYLLPIVGGVLAVTGFASRAREGEIFERFWGTAVVLTLAVGIVSGGSGVHHDRYLAWALPLVIVYAGSGARAVTQRFDRPALFTALSIALVAYQLIGAAFFLSSFAAGCARTASNVRFVKQLAETLPAGSRIGMSSGTGLAYFMPGHHITHVSGVVSPAFAYPQPNVMAVEILKRQPELRFDYWLLKSDSLRTAWYRPLVGAGIIGESREINGASALALFQADWSTLAEPNLASEDGRVAKVISQLEVGLASSEKQHDYRLRDRAPGARIELVLVTGRFGPGKMSDVGRVVLGGETFRVATPPSGRLNLVMRTAWRADALVRNSSSTRGQRFQMKTPLPLSIRIGGEQVATPSLPLQPDADLIQEFSIEVEIPEAQAGDPWIEIEIDGEYVSLGYRFYDADERGSAAGQ